MIKKYLTQKIEKLNKRIEENLAAIAICQNNILNLEQQIIDNANKNNAILKNKIKIENIKLQCLQSLHKNLEDTIIDYKLMLYIHKNKK